MNLDPVIFDNALLETANEAVLFCKNFFVRSENAGLIPQLENVCPVTDLMMAYLARNTLRGMLPNVKGAAARNYVQIAINTLTRALNGEGGEVLVLHIAPSA